MKILLVEDDKDLCAAFARILKYEGMETVTAHDGCKAEQILLSLTNNIDLIVCDVMMPNMNGFELLQRISCIPALKNIPFIYTTARVSREEETKGLMLGAKAYLKKPLDMPYLTDLIRKLVKK